MSGKFVRASKYRHVFGQPAKRELCYENLKITKNAWDSNIINSNGKYLSVNWDASGGGAFAVIPLSEIGKAPDTVPLFRGHKAAVLDTAFDPFDKERLVSCSEDGNICVWRVPEDYSFRNYYDENDNIKDITEPESILKGHSKKVGHVEFHPCVKDILASCSLDYSVKIWDIETGKDVITLPHKDLVTSFTFNYNGSLLATTSRDKKLRIWDIRAQKIISEGPGHTGAKPSRVTWLGNTDRIITTGFSRLSDRQVGIWDINKIDAGPIGGFVVIDSSSGVLIPTFDEYNSILYLAGKGDGNIRYYEYDNDDLHELSQFASTDPQRGFAAAPKSSVNVRDNEILKSFKTVNDNSIEPVSFIVPRKSELFQDDIYPDCPSSEPVCSSGEWLDGKEVNGPLLMSMKALFEGTKPSIKESDPAVSISSKREQEAKAAAEAKSSSAKTSPKKSVEKTTPIKDFSRTAEATSGGSKKIDDALKDSKKVSELLNKVNDTQDGDDILLNDKSDEGWEEIEKPKISRDIEESKKTSATETARVKSRTGTPEIEKKSSDESSKKSATSITTTSSPSKFTSVGSAGSKVSSIAPSIDKLEALIKEYAASTSALKKQVNNQEEVLKSMEKLLKEIKSKA